jgi:hypothetical protein
VGTDRDPAVESLVRHLYWEQGSASRGAMGSAELRDRLVELTAQMRTDQKLPVPFGEDTLTSPSPWRRRVKYALFRLARPVSWRYDRLIGDLADLTTGLAEQLQAAEAEIARLRERLGDEPPEAGPRGGTTP